MNLRRIWAITGPWTSFARCVRKGIFQQREHEAQREAKDKLVDALVDQHDFPVPEVFVERQIRNRLEQSLRGLAEQGVDPEILNLDWEKIKEAQRERAIAGSESFLAAGASSGTERISNCR